MPSNLHPKFEQILGAFTSQTRRQFGEPGECATCERERAKQKDGVIPFFPPHDASKYCESGGRNHCTCDTCF